MRFYNRKISLIVFFIGGSIPNFGQDFNPLNITAAISPTKAGHHFYNVNTRIGLGYPILKSANNTLLIGINYYWFQYKVQSDSLIIDDLYSLSVPLVFMHRINNRYKFIANTETGISSDKLGFSPDNLKYILNLSLVRFSNDTTKWVINLQVSRQHGGLSISPNFYADVRLFGKMYFNGILPFKPKLTWKANSRYQYGIAVNTDRNTFYLNKNDYKKYVEDTQVDLDLFYQFRLSRNLKISASMGYTFLHKIKIYEEDEKVPVKVYIFDGSNKKSIKSEPDNIEFKIRLFWSIN